MWDWDEKPEPKPDRRTRTLTRGDRITIGAVVGVLVVLVALGAGLVLRLSYASARAEPGRTAEAMEMLTGGGLRVANADPGRLQPGETLVLLDDDSRIEVTPGRAPTGAPGCAVRPHVAVEIAVTGTGAPVTLDPALFRLDVDGELMPVSGTCSAAPATVGGGDELRLRLVFEAESGRRLTYGPSADLTQAAWLLE